jgi:cholesterol oxidase
MGRDSSGATTGFDGKGLTTSARRSNDSALYDEVEWAIANVGHHYGPKRMLLNLLSGRGPEGLFTVHPLGGCSIGREPDEGFTDHRGEVFGHPGLFVADGSVYPKSPGIAPSMTIAALAERQATLIAADEGSRHRRPGGSIRDLAETRGTVADPAHAHIPGITP